MKCKLSICLLFSFFSFSLHAEGFMQVANIVKLKGAVYINKEKIENGAEIASFMNLSIPLKDDFVLIKFQNGHLVKFSGAEVKVEEINPKEGRFKLLKGKAYAIVNPLTQDEKFSINTSKVNFEVRGTKFFIEEKSAKSFLVVIDGVVSAQRDNAIVEVRKNQELTVKAKEKMKRHSTPSKVASTLNAHFEEMQKP